MLELESENYERFRNYKLKNKSMFPKNTLQFDDISWLYFKIIENHENHEKSWKIMKNHDVMKNHKNHENDEIEW